MKATTRVHSLSRAEMVELGILGLGLSISLTGGFIALLRWVS